MKQYKDLKSLAAKSKPLFVQYYKKNKKRLVKMDQIVHQLHEDVTAKINCLECANCCKTLGPAIYDKDIERIAKALRLKPAEVVDRYLRIDEDGDYVFREMPCPFLLSDNYCSIYESRPKACREYPHTDRKRFHQLYPLTMTNSSTCPITYQILHDLLSR